MNRITDNADQIAKIAEAKQAGRDDDIINGGPVHNLGCCCCKATTGWISWRDAHQKGWRKFNTSWKQYSLCPACVAIDDSQKEAERPQEDMKPRDASRCYLCVHCLRSHVDARQAETCCSRIGGKPHEVALNPPTFSCVFCDSTTRGSSHGKAVADGWAISESIGGILACCPECRSRIERQSQPLAPMPRLLFLVAAVLVFLLYTTGVAWLNYDRGFRDAQQAEGRES